MTRSSKQLGRRCARQGRAAILVTLIGVLSVVAAASASASSPTVTGLAPKSGPPTGGTTVTIEGTNLTGATAVTFGSTAAASFTVTSTNSITAVSPPEPTGTVDVSVTTPVGTSPVLKKDRFSFASVGIISLSPSVGPISGGMNVTVTGFGFDPGAAATKFKFGRAKAAAVNCASSTTCTVIAPAHDSGTVDVTATVQHKRSAIEGSADQFTYVPAGANTWELTQSFAEHPQENPLPDQLGNPGVWSWMSGEADTPASYSPLAFESPAEVEAECPTVVGFDQWFSVVTRFPTIGYNSGPRVKRNGTGCAPSAEFPSNTVLTGPGVGSNLSAVFNWRSPVTGTVMVSGSLRCTDRNVQGIAWELDRGSSILLGPIEKTDDNVTAFGPLAVSVNAGESLYLEIGPGLSNGAFDTTAVTFTIIT